MKKEKYKWFFLKNGLRPFCQRLQAVVGSRTQALIYVSITVLGFSVGYYIQYGGCTIKSSVLYNYFLYLQLTIKI